MSLAAYAVAIPLSFAYSPGSPAPAMWWWPSCGSSPTRASKKRCIH